MLDLENVTRDLDMRVKGKRMSILDRRDKLPAHEVFDYTGENVTFFSLSRHKHEEDPTENVQDL